MSIQDNPYPRVLRSESDAITSHVCYVCGGITPHLYTVPGFSGARCWRCLLALGEQLAEDATEHTYDTYHNDNRGGY